MKTEQEVRDAALDLERKRKQAETEAKYATNDTACLHWQSLAKDYTQRLLALEWVLEEVIRSL